MSLVFPEDYGKAESSKFQKTNDVPMMGFQALKISEKQTLGSLSVAPVSSTAWVWLPVPTEGLSTSYANSWDEATVSMQAAAIESGIDTAGDWWKKNILGQDTGDQAGNAGVEGGISGVKGAIMEFTKSKMGMTTGVTKRMLEQAYISYSGPGYRSHEFSFSLKPKSESESKLIEQIVMFFKRHSAPTQQGGVANIVRMYSTPHLFNIVFSPDNGLPQISASACTNVGVKYGGEKYTTFADDNMPIQVDISLSFKEMKLHDSTSFSATTKGGDF